MPASVRKTAQAFGDLERIVRSIQTNQPRTGRAFLKAAEATFAQLARKPHIGQSYPHPRASDLRVSVISRRFRNYVVFYRPIPDGIEIIRVLHGAQDVATELYD